MAGQQAADKTKAALSIRGFKMMTIWLKLEKTAELMSNNKGNPFMVIKMVH